MIANLTAGPGPGTYADQVRIIHTQVGERGQAPTQVVQVTITPHGNNIDLDWLNAQIEALHYGAPFNLSQRRTHVSWGADAVQAEFLIETLQMFGTIGATLTVEHGWETLINRLRSFGFDVRYGRVESLTDAETIERGQNLIEHEYSIGADTLTPKKVSHDSQNQTSTFAAQGRDGSIYSVTFRIRGHSTTLISRTRTLPPN